VGDLIAHELGFQSIIGFHLLSIEVDPEHVVIHQQAHLVANLPGKFLKPGNSIHPLHCQCHCQCSQVQSWVIGFQVLAGHLPILPNIGSHPSYSLMPFSRNTCFQVL
jgi:hypothetical protein